MLRLQGIDLRSAFIIVVVVALQLAIAVAASHLSLVWIAALAATIGAFISIALWAMIHECTHGLVVRGKVRNMVAATVANLPHVVPIAGMFRQVHLQHHAHLGVYELDGDLPSRWEARLTSAGIIGKAIWLSFFPIWAALRVLRVRGIRVTRAVVLTGGAHLAFDVVLFLTIGWRGIAYLLLSFFLSVGLHPLGARWLQEHHITDRGQETYSYYGSLNRLLFNIGYHTEHHDFPAIPWSRLPRLRASAPEYYDTLQQHHSWTHLLIRFLTDRRDTLFQRIVRKPTRRGAER